MERFVNCALIVMLVAVIALYTSIARDEMSNVMVARIDSFLAAFGYDAKDPSHAEKPSRMGRTLPSASTSGSLSQMVDDNSAVDLRLSDSFAAR